MKRMNNCEKRKNRKKYIHRFIHSFIHLLEIPQQHSCASASEKRQRCAAAMMLSIFLWLHFVWPYIFISALSFRKRAPIKLCVRW